MGTHEFQRSFVGGELSTLMHARPDDARYQHGASKLQNLISWPQGPAVKRPGLRHVRAVKDHDNRAGLIPFKFSRTQSSALEIGVAEVDSRDIGYIRQHVDGGTVLYTLPPAYITVKAIATGVETDTLTTTVDHDLQDGDPVIITPQAGGVGCTFSSGTPGTVDVVTHGFVVGQQVVIESNLGIPVEIEELRLYYVATVPTADTFTITPVRGGVPMDLSSGVSGWVAAMPHGVEKDIDAGVRFYAIVNGTDSLQLAITRQDALDGTQIDIDAFGTSNDGDLRLHFDYDVGALVSISGASFYCSRRPADVARWAPYVTASMHIGYATSDTNFWVSEPGVWASDAGALTFNTGTNEIDWGAAHGFAIGEEVSFDNVGGALPAVTGDALTETDTYYIRAVPASDTFTISRTPGGTVVDFTGTGSGTNTVLVGAVFEVPHYFELADLGEVHYAQSLDVLTLVHPKRPAREIARLGATQWTSEDIAFNGGLAPETVTVTPNYGFGFRVTAVTAVSPAVLTTNENHALTVLVDVFLVVNTGDIPPAVYTGIATTSGTTITLATLDHENQGSGTTDVSAESMVIPLGSASNEDTIETYVVTALDATGQESRASDEIAQVNPLFAAGAFNTIVWSAVTGAERYRIYKKQEGVFGIIGEVETAAGLTFRDESFNPELSKTPPIPDDTIHEVRRVTFDATNHVVVWADHGLVAGTPVIFQSTGDLPTAVEPYKTYYVFDPSDIGFQVADAAGVTLALSGGDLVELHDAIAGIFPAGVCYFEQRRALVGSLVKGRRIVMTNTGTESDMSYTLPSKVSNRLQVDVASRELEFIEHAVPLSHLMVISDATEYRITPLNDDALTPDSIASRTQSFVGGNSVQPMLVHNAAIYAARRGGHVREMGYGQDQLSTVPSYLSGDLSIRSTHLFDTYEIEDLAFSKAPTQIIWAVSSQGRLLGMTYIPEETVAAWHRHETLGTFEAVVSIPEGDEDHAYVIVQRNIGGEDVRHVERMTAQEFSSLEVSNFVDCGVSYSGASTTQIWAPHLEGETGLVALADGLVQTGLSVVDGFATLATAATQVQLGLPYTARIETLPAYMQVPGLGADREKNVSMARLRVRNSGAFKVGALGGVLKTPSNSPAAGTLLSGTIDALLAGLWEPDGQMAIEQSTPLPLTVSSLAYEVASGGGRR